MKVHYSIALVLVFVLGCKKPLPALSEAALAMPSKIEKTKESIVFIAGFDEGDNTYYTNAEKYFSAQGMHVVTGLFSLEEIITWINQKGTDQPNFDKVHIVSHSNAWLGMSLKTTKNGERIRLKSLQKAKSENKIPRVTNGIDAQTKIIFHSCGLGENLVLLQELKSTFTTTEAPKICASTFFNVFGGKFAGHYLAKPYYAYYPTAESPGPLQLSKEFKATYPKTKLDWFTALKTRKEASLGEAYSFKFNIPIEWEFVFDTAADVPLLEGKEAIMDWVSESPEMAEVLFEFNIPLEKYRWKTEIHGRILKIKGKTTVLCVLAPILQDYDTSEYRTAQLNDCSIYQKV